MPHRPDAPTAGLLGHVRVQSARTAPPAPPPAPLPPLTGIRPAEEQIPAESLRLQPAWPAHGKWEGGCFLLLVILSEEGPRTRVLGPQLWQS